MFFCIWWKISRISLLTLIWLADGLEAELPGKKTVLETWRFSISRIADAADLVGDLEPIITSELVEINQLIITKGFSDSEIEKRIHEIELRIEEEKATREDFDEQRYELVNDTGFRDEFENDVEKSRILPEDS